MTGALPEPIVVDARGLRCPLPVIELAKAARDVPAGTVLTVLTSDPAARHDVPAWSRMRGHTLVSITLAEGLPGSAETLAITVRTEA